MKNLLKLLIVVIVSSMATESFAQVFGVKAGLNLSTMLVKDNEETYTDDFKMNPGFHVGITSEFPLSDAFSFETGLLLSTKGFKVSEEETDGGVTYEYKAKANLMYLDIPLTAKGYFDLGGPKIYGTFGPYIGLGIGGKYKTEYTIMGNTETEEEKIKWGSDKENDDFKTLDFGLTVGAGLQIDAIQVGFSYGLGLANISNFSEDSYRENNRVFGVSVGYRFGGN